jgi:hypothetical protein
MQLEPDDLESAYTRVEEAGRGQAVLNALREVDPTILSLKILMVKSVLSTPTPVLFVESSSGGDATNMWPMTTAGSGFKRLFLLVAQAAAAKGLVCLDDPDCFLHPKMFRLLATFLWDLVEKHGAQVLVATHSIDFMIELARDINGAPRSPLYGLFGFERSEAESRELLELPRARAGARASREPRANVRHVVADQATDLDPRRSGALPSPLLRGLAAHAEPRRERAVVDVLGRRGPCCVAHAATTPHHPDLVPPAFPPRGPWSHRAGRVRPGPLTSR